MAEETSKLPSLFRRRQVFLPTFWGALFLSALAAAIATATLRNLGRFLAPNDPAGGHDGRGARTLVIEGWLDPDALDDGIALIAHASYERVVTSGASSEDWRDGEARPTHADRAADYLRRHGVTRIPVFAAAASATATDRTFRSALAVRDWMRGQGISTDVIDLYSGGVHARRSRRLYQMAFGPDAEVGILAARPRHYSIERWWSTSEGTKSVLDEAISLVWTTCFFWPSVPGVDKDVDLGLRPVASQPSSGKRE